MKKQPKPAAFAANDLTVEQREHLAQAGELIIGGRLYTASDLAPADEGADAPLSTEE